jgi:hypothetical protein
MFVLPRFDKFIFPSSITELVHKNNPETEVARETGACETGEIGAWETPVILLET